MRIVDLMTSEVRSCSPSDPLSRAAEIMWEGDCGSVPVVDPARRVVGMITDRDIAMAAYFKREPIQSIRVDAVMSRQVFSVSPLEPAESAEMLMQQKAVRRLPVVDEQGVLIGIVSLADLAYHMAHSQTFGADGMSWLGIGRTLAKVSEPRQRPRYLKAG
jgi:CBS domain-containing protein